MGRRAGVAVGWAMGLSLGAGAAVAEPEPSPARLEGAVGLTLRHGAAYLGSAEMGNRLSPAGFIRYGRFTLTGSGGFTVRTSDEVERGLAAELARQGKLRFSLGLRYDPGRTASDSGELAGLGDIRGTLRARWSARWDPSPTWRVSAGFSHDLLGRGGGVLGDLGVTRRWPLGPGESLFAGATLAAGGAQYMQAWHGVTPAQSQASGLPAYEAGAGLRDLHLALGWRTEFQAWGQPFAASVSAGYTRLLGSAVDSPLTHRAGYPTASGAVVWRF